MLPELHRLLWLGAVVLCLNGCRAAQAESALVAVATNFAEVMQRLETDFEAQSGHSITVVAGSTGKLYAQVVAGAPFDVLLAADQLRPLRLEQEGLAVPGSRFTYAGGSLTLWSADPQRLREDGASVLRGAAFRRLAIANPALAPYGVAAREVLQNLGVYARLSERIVMGENVGQAHAMVATGNAELGLVATSQVSRVRRQASANSGGNRGGSRWDVPSNLYAPIRQDAVLLRRGRDNAAAVALLDYLRGEQAGAVLQMFGYRRL